MKKEKVIISRDEDDDNIYLWRKPVKGNWSPSQLKDCEMVNWQREDITNVDIYFFSDFKKKFGITIKKKIKKSVNLPSHLIHNEDYKLFSDDPKRKK